MPDTHVTKNFMAHDGNEWVIGGRLTFLPGAVVEGAEGLFDGAAEDGATQRQIDFIADSEATTVAALKNDFNALMAALRTAGLMAAASTDPSGDEPESGT